MRIAIVSDIHGNLPALEAVITDLGAIRPNLVLHGGDLALGGPHPVEVVDRIRQLGWPSVLGNTDEALGEDPAALESRSVFVAQAASSTAGLRTTWTESLRTWSRWTTRTRQRIPSGSVPAAGPSGQAERRLHDDG
jgi:Icc-related predicted phosphoesterase